MQYKRNASAIPANLYPPPQTEEGNTHDACKGCSVSTGLRYTLDIAHLAGEDIIRRHITWLPATSALVIENFERAQPGRVFIEKRQSVPGDPDWNITYRNPLIDRGFAGVVT